ncbi:MAG: thiamine pyrophosphate-binding protein [Alphaproteobacteria bacterium]|nr:thiamine pyrophosphate-binding protein [Alphaproteobacteria bacterium]
MKNYLDGGDAILQAFRNLGVDYIMSSPGSEWGSVWEALARQTVDKTPGPEYLSCWHETLAADMAIGYTMATGRMQVVMLHAGVGLLQGSVGIHAAHIQNIPMLVMSGEALTYGERDGFDPGQQWYQNLSVVGGPQRLVEPYVKFSGQVPSADTLYESVVRAGQMSQRTPMGPVYLNVPIETMLQEWKKPAPLALAPAPIAPRAPLAEIERVAEHLLAAKNPVITTEAAARQPAAYATLLALAEALAIPVVETPSSIFSNFPKDHELHQGPSFKPFFETADLVLVIRSRAPWYPPSRRPPNAHIVLIDDNPFRHHMVYQNLHADTVLEGDVAFTIETLAAAVGAARPASAAIEERRARHAAAHRKNDADRLAAVAAARTKTPIHPIALTAALAEALPGNTAYVDETVTHRGVVEAHLRNKGPQSFFKVRGGLGQGLGHAIGVKLALRDRPVVSLIGDGSFLYNPVTQSLGYAQRAGLPIIIVIYNNNQYRAMRDNHEDYYPDGVAHQHDLWYGAPIGGPDYATLGEPFGCWGRRVEDPAALVPALRDAHRATLDGRTAILNVVIDP